MAIHMIRAASFFAAIVAIAGLDGAAHGRTDAGDLPPAPCAILVPPGGVAAGYAANGWPGGVVPYEFDANVTLGNQAAALVAMAKIESVAGVDFVPRASQPNYLHIQNSAGNSSYVGMQGGGQIVNIYNWNYTYIMVHEFMHALAFWHEQSRPDRDSYVTVNYGSIQSGYEHNFDIQADAAAFGPYDFDSVMHYDQCAFSTCCPAGSSCSACLTTPACRTITVLPPNEPWQTAIGQLTHLSGGDIAGLRRLYCTSWAALASGVSPGRGYVDAAYDAGRSVAVLFGGYNPGVPGNVLGDTWELTDAGWTLVANSGPSPRSHAALAYDSARGVTILFGGNGSPTPQGDTWEWNGRTWSQRSTTGPSPRYVPSMAYDEDRGVTVLFGGSNNTTGVLGDTWEYDGATGVWTQRSTTGPTPRTSSSMVYDRAHGVMVLFGGGTADAYLNDTWEWHGDAGTWTQIAAAGPSARSSHKMVFDPTRNRTVLFGGYAGGAPTGLNDTWEWDGSSWTQLSSGGPSRYIHGMVYDIQRGSMVVVGGFSNGWIGSSWEFLTGFPGIVTQPVPVLVDAGEPASFSVTANPGLSPTYRWRRNGVNLTNAGAVSGAHESVLTINPVQSTHAGIYDVVVSAPCGSIASDAVALTVIVPCAGDLDGDQQVDGADLGVLLGGWGQEGVSDLDGSGATDGADLGVLLGAWGPC